MKIVFTANNHNHSSLPFCHGLCRDWEMDICISDISSKISSDLEIKLEFEKWAQRASWESVQDLKHWLVAQEVSRFCFLSILEFIRYTLYPHSHSVIDKIDKILKNQSRNHFQNTILVGPLSNIVIVGHRRWGGTKSQPSSERGFRRDCQVLLGPSAQIFTGT